MELDDWSWTRRVLFGTWQCVGLGFVAAALESVVLAATLQLPLTGAQFLLLGAFDAVLLGLLAAVVGVLPGLVLHLGKPDERTRISTLFSAQVATAAFLLCGWFLWQGALDVWLEGGQPIGAAAMAAMPMGFAGVTYFNARFWFRRIELGRPTAPIGWVPIAAVAMAVTLVGSMVAWGQRDTGGTYALEGDRNVVVVTVDGLRRDRVGVLGGPSSRAVDALAADPRGVVFANAVSPTPSSRAANATVLTGLHPLRLKVLDDGDTVSRAYRTLAEVLDDEDYATGAFVSSGATSAASGLAQGFRVYDDDFGGGIAGAGRLNVVALAARVWAALRDGPEQGRSASATVDRFEAWLGAHGDVPLFGWVHLADPHLAVAGGGSDEAAVAAVDVAVGRIVAAIEAAGVADRTLVVVAGTHGELLGEHGGRGNRTLFDEVVRVPLLMRAPGLTIAAPRVDAQVRLMDVAPTVVEWLGLDELDQSEGVALTGHAAGTRRATIWCALVGQDLDGSWLIGLRNNGVKFMAAGGDERLFSVDDDPSEAHDLATEQPAIADQARSLLASDAVALEALR